jgi:glycosyltransferase involved in cell wall biosynthesis
VATSLRHWGKWGTALLKILQIYNTDYLQGGGGGISTYRLHQGFKRAGHDAKVLCRIKTTESVDSIVLPRQTKFEDYLHTFTRHLGLNHVHYVSSFRIPKHPAYQQADVLRFTSFRDGFGFLALPKLTQNKPSVLTLHDIWPFTGHCAVAYDCERWKTGCGKCPYPEVIPAIKRDATHLEWKLKDWTYQHSNLVVVSRSTPVTEQAKQSILSRFPIHQIPGGIPTEDLRPLDPAKCRAVLGIPQKSHVIMFAALSIEQPWKGADLLLEALHGLPAKLKANTILLLLGGRGEGMARASGMQTMSLGRVMVDRVKAIFYSAADLFVSPSRAEAFGLVALESLACGTPAVSFAVGGAVDYIRPGITGYLAEPENVDDLRTGIIQLLEDDASREAMGQQAREMVVREYSLDQEAQRYIQLFEKMLKDSCR